MRGTWRSIALVFGMLLVVAEAVAQEPTPDPLAPAKSEEIIEVPEIPKRTEAIQLALERFFANPTTDDRIVTIEAELPGLRERNSLEARNTTSTLDGEVSLGKLSDLERGWKARRLEIQSWIAILEKDALLLEQQIADLGRAKSVWTGSRDKARQEDAPREILDTVRKNLDSINAAIEESRNRRRTILALLTSTSQADRETDETLEKITLARSLLRARIFEPDSERLWTALSEVDSDNAVSRVIEAMKVGWSDLQTFASKRQTSFAPLITAFVAAILLGIYVRQKLRAKAPDEHLEGSVGVFERPISVAMVISGCVAALMYPLAPQLVRNSIGVVLFVPLVRTLMPVVPPTSVRLLGALSGFYLLDRIRDAIMPAIVFERLLFLVEMLAAVGVAWWLLRPTRRDDQSSGTRPSELLSACLKIASLAALVSAIANLFGYVEMARLLGGGVLASLYLSVAVYASYRIATTLVVLALSSRWLATLGVVRSNAPFLIRLATHGLKILATVTWALGTLERFAIREPVVDGIKGVLSTPLEVGTVSVALGDVLAFPLTILLAMYVSRAIRSVLEEDVFTRVHLGRGVGNAISTTVHYSLLLGGFFLALGASGIDLGRFSLLAGAFGVGIGFGLQNIVNNFVSGLVLLFERPIQVGDMIELNGLLADVKHIGIRASTVTTMQGAEVVIPNGTLLSDQLINWTLSNKHSRVELPIGVAYGNRPADVIEILQGVLDHEARILNYPAPMVLFKGFGDSSLDFELRFWAPDYRTRVVLASDVACAIYDELDRAGIAIPFPQRDLHLRSVDPDVALRLRGGDEVA